MEKSTFGEQDQCCAHAPPASETTSSPDPSATRRLDWIVLFASLTVAIVPTWLAEVPRCALSLERNPLHCPRIDICTAPWYEWTLLEGIGAARARRIVDFRDGRGGFASIDELEEVPMIPRGWVDRARPYLIRGSHPAVGEGPASHRSRGR